MRETVFSAEITLTRYLDPQGQPLGPLPEGCAQLDQLRDDYRWMVLGRQFDQKAIALQRTGQLGTYPSSLGCEAIDVVSASLLQSDDVLVPYYRNHVMQMIRGLPMRDILLYWGGDERGSANPAMGRDLPNAVPIATQALHATGVATALKLRHQPQAVLCMIGDGGTSKGDFFEALNLTGVWQLPLVMIINNNQWAISVPRHLQCAAATLAQKGLAAGVRSEQVDGNDPVALREVVGAALTRARNGKGPTLIEALSYRLGDHTTADDATRYRDNEQVRTAWQHDALSRLRQFLHQRGAWDETQEQQWLEHCRREIQAAVEQYQAMEPEPVEALFDHLYAERPAILTPQIAAAQHKRESAHE